MAISPELRALAGLLHDIGEFALRAGWSGDRSWDEEARREFGYQHAMLSADFARRVVPAPWLAAVVGPVGNHHRPVAEHDRTLQRADQLSAAGHDDDEADEVGNQPPQLLSIFSGLQGGAAGGAYLPLRPLALVDKTIFAGPALSQRQVDADYSTLWKWFEGEAAALRDVHAADGDLASYLESLHLLLQKYTWCVPASESGARPDISLYDHARTTAALAAVLDGAHPQPDDAHARQDSAVALLVGGDLSGIQDFLYTITAKGATPSLRGRSFYLQLLTEVAARFLLRALQLPAVCLLYAGGGNFTLLARAGDEEAVERAQAEIGRVLLAHHQGELALLCGSVPVSETDFSKGAIGKRWDDLRGRLQRAKQRRFSHLSTGELEEFFDPQGYGGDERSSCAVCGRENPGIETESEDSGTEVRKCALCRSFEQLGDGLRQARYLLLSERDGQSPAAGGYAQVLAELGAAIELSDTRPAPPIHSAAPRRLLLALHDGLDLKAAHPREAVGRRLLVNATPLMNKQERALLDAGAAEDGDPLPQAGRIKSFGLLERQSTGIKRLGVLRMDVDDMGELFRSGFGAPGDPANTLSLARLAGLSFALSLFFEGWLDRLAQQVNEEKETLWRPDGKTALPADRLYAIYSGGDDLFFVGSWDAVINFAVRVRQDLARYAGNHPRIHASAGLVLVGGKYPLYQAAADAGAAEARAKAHLGKDAITFLNETLPWSSFAPPSAGDANRDPFATVQGIAKWLEDYVDKTKERSLLRLLLDQYESYLKQRKQLLESQGAQGQAGQPQTPWGPWTWRSLYYLHRAAERRAERHEGEARELRELAQALAADFKIMERLGVAARWADYLTRG